MTWEDTWEAKTHTISSLQNSFLDLFVCVCIHMSVYVYECVCVQKCVFIYHSTHMVVRGLLSGVRSLLLWQILVIELRSINLSAVTPMDGVGILTEAPSKSLLTSALLGELFIYHSINDQIICCSQKQVVYLPRQFVPKKQSCSLEQWVEIGIGIIDVPSISGILKQKPRDENLQTPKPEKHQKPSNERSMYNSRIMKYM